MESARFWHVFTRKCMTYARKRWEKAHVWKTPTLLRRGENIGRSGGVFGMVFAQRFRQDDRIDWIYRILIFLGQKEAKKGKKILPRSSRRSRRRNTSRRGHWGLGGRGEFWHWISLKNTDFLIKEIWGWSSRNTNIYNRGIVNRVFS